MSKPPPSQFAVGDTVAVVDLRDGTVVVPSTEIKSLEYTADPGIPARWVASVSEGFGVSEKCLFRLGTNAPHLWCNDCGSYHVDPQNRAHHMALKCRKTFQ